MVQPGALVLEHHTPTQTSPLATVMAHDGPAARAFAVLREAPSWPPSASSWTAGWPPRRTRS